jgi:hypothetical protein
VRDVQVIFIANIGRYRWSVIERADGSRMAIKASISVKGWGAATVEMIECYGLKYD